MRQCARKELKRLREPCFYYSREIHAGELGNWLCVEIRVLVTVDRRRSPSQGLGENVGEAFVPYG